MSFTPVYYSQRDPAWKNDKLGFSNYTLGTDGCAVAALSMLAAGFGKNTNPSKLNRDLKALGSGNGFIGALVVWGGLTLLYPDIRYQNLVLCRDSDAPLNEINAAIASGNPVLVEVDRSLSSGLQTHWVVLYARQGDDYLMLDPWPYPPDNKPTLLKPRYSYGRSLARTITAVVWYQYSGSTAPPPPVVETDLYLEVSPAASAGLSLRAQPITSSARLAIEPPGTRLRVLEAESIALPKIGVFGQWIRVRDPQGREGYVAAWYVQLAQDPAPPPDEGPPPETPPLPAAQDLVDAINRLRAEHGLPPYQMHPSLITIAQNQAEYMASTGNITHLDAQGNRPYQRALTAGYPLDGDLTQGGFLSENIQAGSNLTVEGVIQAWLADAPHTNTMLSAIYQDVGAGIATDGNLIYYCLDAAKPRPDTGDTGTGDTGTGDTGTGDTGTGDTGTGGTSPPPQPVYTLDVWVSQSVGSRGLRMRDRPDLGGNLVTIVKAGHPLRVLEDEASARQKIGKDGQWLHVRDGKGNTGYVAAWLVTLEAGGGQAPPPPPDDGGSSDQPPADTPPPPEPLPEVTMQARVSLRVSASGLSVRATPSLSGRLISTLRRGQIVRIIEPAAQAQAKIGQRNQWLHILDSRDVPGYVAAWLIDPLETPDDTGAPPPADESDPPPPPPEVTMSVKVSAQASSAGLRVRAAPTSSARVISTVYRGQVLRVIEPRESAQAKIGQRNQWLHVLDARGVPGYVAAWLVVRYDAEETPNPVQPPADEQQMLLAVSTKVGAGSLRLRAQPNGALVGLLKAGTLLTPLEPADAVQRKLGVVGQWLHVRSEDGKTGYVAAWYVEQISGQAPPPQDDRSLTVYVSSLASRGLRMRSGPSTSTAVIGVLMPRTALTVIDPPTADQALARVGRYGQWLKVRTPEGKEGYVAAWYVQT